VDPLPADVVDLLGRSEDKHDLTEDGGGELLLVGDVSEEDDPANGSGDEGEGDCSFRKRNAVEAEVRAKEKGRGKG
jgi:hypothetical protein